MRRIAAFLSAERASKRAPSLASVIRHFRVVEKDVVLEESAGVLSDRIEQPAYRRPCLAVDEWVCAAATTSGRAAMYLGVDGEGRDIERPRALDDLAVLIHPDEV